MKDTNTRKIIFAFLLISAGALLLADNLNLFYIYIPYYLTEWYSFMIFFGLFLLLVRDKVGPGIVALSVGGFFLLSDVFHVNVFSLWPVVLIVIGISILLRKKEQDKSLVGDIGSDDVIDEFAAFSGPQKVIRSQAFRGGKITTVFGGTDIDLSPAVLAEGTNVIDLFTIFGGSTIYVPQDWDVQIKVTSIFGGYSDERSLIEPNDTSRKLVITGTVIFGGGEIKTKYRPA